MMFELENKKMTDKDINHVIARAAIEGIDLVRSDVVKNKVRTDNCQTMIWLQKKFGFERKQ